MWTLGAHHDGGVLGHPERQDPKNALGVPYRTILDDLHPGVLVATCSLDEQGGRPGMQPDRVGDRDVDVRNGDPPQPPSRPATAS